MRLGTLGQLLHTGTKRTPCRFSKPGTSSNLLSLPKNPTPSRATALLHLPYTLPQLLIQGAPLKNPVRPSPTVAPPTSHSCPASCFPFSCAITCSPPSPRTSRWPSQTPSHAGYRRSHPRGHTGSAAIDDGPIFLYASIGHSLFLPNRYPRSLLSFPQNTRLAHHGRDIRACQLPGVPIFLEPPLVLCHPSQFLSSIRAGTSLFLQNR